MSNADDLTRRLSPENNFNAIRVLLALLVIFSHSYALVAIESRGAGDPLASLTGGQTTWGGLAVDGFFAISGYLIVQSWLRSRSGLDYLKKRALRIYPGFAAASVVSVFVAGALAVPDVRAYLARVDYPRFLAKVVMLRTPFGPGAFARNPGMAGVVNGSALDDRLRVRVLPGRRGRRGPGPAPLAGDVPAPAGGLPGEASRGCS